MVKTDTAIKNRCTQQSMDTPGFMNAHMSVGQTETQGAQLSTSVVSTKAQQEILTKTEQNTTLP